MNSATLPDYLTASAFESGYLGGPVCRLKEPDRAADAVACANENGILLIACRTNEDLSAAGFRKIETLVTFEAAFGDLPDKSGLPGVEIRDAGIGDIEACRALAVAVLRQNRFHTDPEIPDAAADAMRAAWIENAIRGRADRVIIAGREGTILGFNAVTRHGDALVIDLIAVAAEAQGTGVGRTLVTVMKQGDSGRRIRVGTQAANTVSLAFYKSLGFRETGRQDTWHWTPAPSR